MECWNGAIKGFPVNVLMEFPAEKHWKIFFHSDSLGYLEWKNIPSTDSTEFPAEKLFLLPPQCP